MVTYNVTCSTRTCGRAREPNGARPPNVTRAVVVCRYKKTRLVQNIPKRTLQYYIAYLQSWTEKIDTEIMKTIVVEQKWLLYRDFWP